MQVRFHIRKNPGHRIAIATVRASQRISRSSFSIGQVRSIVRMIVHLEPRQQRHYRRKPDFTGDHLSPVSGRHHYRSTRTGSPVEKAPNPYKDTIANGSKGAVTGQSGSGKRLAVSCRSNSAQHAKFA